MAIVLSDNIQANAPKSIDSRYLNNLVPYTSVSAANAAILSGVRFTGLTVNILGTEYWYGTGVLDACLVTKSAGGTWGSITGVLSGQTDLQTCLNGKLASGGTAVCATTAGNALKLNNQTASFYLNTGSTALCATTAGNALCLNTHTEGNLSVANSACLGSQLPAYYLNTGSTIAESSVINLPTDLTYLQTQITSLGTIKSQAQIFVFEHPQDGTVAGYEKLSPTVTTLTGATETITVNGTALIDSYITPISGLGVTGITSGVWTFHFHAHTSVANSSGMRFDVYTRRGTGETLQFQSEVIPIITTTIQEYQVSETQLAITGLISTDRLVVKVYAVTTLNRTITWQYTAADFNAYIQVPIFAETAPQWANIASKPSWLSGTTLGAFETGHTHSQYAPLASPNFTTCTCAPIVCATTCFVGSGAGLTGTAASLKSNDSSCLNGVLPAGYLLSGGTAKNSLCLGGALANTYAPLASPNFTTCICTPVMCSTGVVKGTIISGSTCVESPVIQLTTGAAAGCIFTSNATGCGVWCTPAASGLAWSGSTANGIGTYVSATKICSNPNITFDGTKLGVTGNICASTCLCSPNITGSTKVCSPAVYGTKIYENGTCLGSTYLGCAATALCATTAGNALSLGGSLANTYAQLTSPPFVNNICITDASNPWIMLCKTNATAHLWYVQAMADVVAIGGLCVDTAGNVCILGCYVGSGAGLTGTAASLTVGTATNATVATCLYGYTAGRAGSADNAHCLAGYGAGIAGNACNANCLCGIVGTSYLCFGVNDLVSQHLTIVGAGGAYNENIRLPLASGGLASLMMGGGCCICGTDANTWGLFVSGGNFAIVRNSSTFSSGLELSCTGIFSWMNGVCLNATCGIATDWIATSDCRLKTCIKPIMGALSTVMQLQGICYQLCNDELHENQIGLIAQDVEKILPVVVSHSEPNEEDFKYNICDSKLGLKYEKLSAVLIEAIKEQQKQIEEQQKQIVCLRKDWNYYKNYNTE